MADLEYSLSSSLKVMKEKCLISLILTRRVERDKIRHLFLHYETNAILQIVLIPAFLEDKFLWHFTKNGIYTVKSGYKVGLSSALEAKS